MSEEKLKKQIQDITDLYDKERETTRALQNSVKDLRRREPLVQMLWQEVVLMRKLLEKEIAGSSVVAGLPTGRHNQQSQVPDMNVTNKLAVACLALVQNDGLIGDLSSLLPENRIAGRKSDMTASDIPDWLKTNPSALGGNDAISSAQANSQKRMAVLQEELNSPPPPPPDDMMEGMPAAPALGVPLAGTGIPAAPTLGGPAAPTGPLLQGGPVVNVITAGGPPAPMIPGMGGPPAPMIPGMGGPPAPMIPGMGGPPAPMIPGMGGPPAPSLPGMGGPPAAPMLGGGPAPMMSFGPEPSKKLIKPNRKMKALHWKAIIIGDKTKRDDVAKKSVWSEIEGVYEKLLAGLDINDLENKFSALMPKKNLPSGPAGGPVTVAKVEDNKPIRLLDPKRHNQMSIMFSKMKKPHELKEVILAMDDTKITGDQLNSLHQNLFNAEEVELVKDSGIPFERLQLPEQQIMVLSSIPQLAARLECWRFSQVFNDLFKDVNEPLCKIENSCKVLRSSDKFKKILALVLALGNYINGGTPRGQSDGFNLDSLNKLVRLKDSEGASLLDYLVRLLETQFGADFIPSVHQEMSIINEIKNLSLKTISAEGRKIQGKTNLVTKMRSLVGSQSTGNDVFEKKLGKFLDEADAKVKILENKCKTVFTDFVDVILYLEPDMERSKAEGTSSEEYFVVIDEFINTLNRAFNEAKRKRDQAEAAAKRQANMESMKAKIRR